MLRACLHQIKVYINDTLIEAHSVEHIEVSLLSWVVAT